MRATAKSIDAISPKGAKLLVTRNDVKGTITLSTTTRMNRRNAVIADVTLDARGWHELLQCAAFPPESPAPEPVNYDHED